MAGNTVNTKLLLPCLGDRGNVGHEITVHGTPVLKSFGAEGNSLVGTSGFFNGSSYLTVPDHTDFQPGTSDFTIALWIFPTVTINNKELFGKSLYASPYTGWWVEGGSGDILRFYTNGAGTYIATTVPLSIGKWNYVELAYSSGVLRIFINGVLGGSGSVSSFQNYSNSLSIGRRSLTGVGTMFQGYIGHVGVYSNCVHNSDASYSPPTSPTDITEDSNLKLYIKFDSTEDSGWIQGGTPTSFTDSGSTGHTVTVVGVSGCTFWWDGAFELDGATEYLSIPDDASLELGSADFVIDGWFCKDTTYPSGDSYPILFGKGNDVATTNNYWLWFYDNGGSGVLYFSYRYGGTRVDVSSGFTPVNNRLYHFAVVRNGADLKIFIDGVQQGTTHDISTRTIQTASGLPLIIASINPYASGVYYFDGFIPIIRISTGTTRSMESGFTPPSAPLESDTNTKLLLQPSGNSAVGGENHNVTLTDGIVLSQETDTGFNSSWKFDGTGDYVAIPDSGNWDIA